jgi:hypothetical protein
LVVVKLATTKKNLFLQQEIFLTRDVAIKLYYEEFFNIRNNSPLKLQKWMERAIKHVRKDHYSAYCKHLLVCDPSLASNFLMEI